MEKITGSGPHERSKEAAGKALPVEKKKLFREMWNESWSAFKCEFLLVLKLYGVLVIIGGLAMVVWHVLPKETQIYLASVGASVDIWLRDPNTMQRMHLSMVSCMRFMSMLALSVLCFSLTFVTGIGIIRMFSDELCHTRFGVVLRDMLMMSVPALSVLLTYFVMTRESTLAIIDALASLLV